MLPLQGSTLFFVISLYIERLLLSLHRSIKSGTAEDKVEQPIFIINNYTVNFKLLSAALLLFSSGTASVMADAVLTVNGQKVENTVARLSFEGDNVKVTFIDDSTLSHDMGDVSFSFVSSVGVETVSSFGSLTVTVGKQLEISGISEGCSLQVYDLHGRLSAKATASGESCVIDISNLEGGAYILKAGNEIVKFIKR